MFKFKHPFNVVSMLLKNFLFSLFYVSAAVGSYFVSIEHIINFLQTVCLRQLEVVEQ